MIKVYDGWMDVTQQYRDRKPMHGMYRNTYTAKISSKSTFSNVELSVQLLHYVNMWKNTPVLIK